MRELKARFRWVHLAAALLCLAGALSPVCASMQEARDDSVFGDDFSLLDLPATLMGGGSIAELLSQPLPGQAGDGGRGENAPGTVEFHLSATNRLDMHARDIEVVEALAQLRILVERNIIVAPDIVARFTGDLYDLDVEEAIDAMCRSTGLVARYEGSFVYIEADEQASRIFELQYVRGEDLVTLIAPLLSETGLASATLPAQQGITPSQEDAGGDGYASLDVLLVHDFPANLEAVAEVVEVLDVRPKQVLMEATILSASLTDEFAAGIDFNLLQGVNFEDIGASSSNGTSVTYGGFTGEQLNDGAGAATTSLTNLLPTGGLNVGFLNHGAGFFIRALEQLTDTTILANPRIIALNKQRGEVLLGRRDGFLTTTVTQTSSTQRVEYLETGTRLVFRAFIGDDEFVRLEIHPEDSDGGVTADGLPFKETAEVTTNVLVRSGQTIVLGGLFRERVQKVNKSTPWLGSLPLLGPVFQSQDDVATREEIIVMLTPHILDSADSLLDPSAAVAGLVDRAALSGAYVYTARNMMQEGDYAGALMFLEASRELDPLRVEVGGLQREVFASLVPDFASRLVDARILDEILSAPIADAGEAPPADWSQKR